MNHPLHVNLFLRAEMRSPAPVRLRVMAPVLASVLVAVFGLLALMLRTVIGSTESEILNLEIEKGRLTSPHKKTLALQAELATVQAGLRQLELYQKARLEWGELLRELPGHVPSSLQFLEFSHAYPPQPQSAPGSPLLAPENLVETGRVTLNGRTTDSESVTRLLAAFRQAPFDRLLGEARVPPGAFRQEPRRQDSTGDVLLFEVEATCPPRRFE